MTSPTERNAVLEDIATVAIRDLVQVWRRTSLVDTDFFETVSGAFVEVATSYADISAAVAAQWYTESAAAAGLTYQASPAAAKSAEALMRSARWSLGAQGEQGLSRMSGSLQRAVFDAARETVVINVPYTGSRWVRYAQPGACAFCRMQATRHDNPRFWYRSERSALDVVGRQTSTGAAPRGTRAVGSRGYHDFCRCTAVEVHVGQEYAPPDYVQEWDTEYQKARANAGSGDPKKILSAWREQGAK